MAHSSPDLAGDVDVITHAAVCICHFLLFRFKNKKLKVYEFYNVSKISLAGLELTAQINPLPSTISYADTGDQTQSALVRSQSIIY